MKTDTTLLCEAALNKAGIPADNLKILKTEDPDIFLQVRSMDVQIHIDQVTDSPFDETISYKVFGPGHFLLAIGKTEFYEFELDGARYKHLVPEMLSCELCDGKCKGCRYAVNSRNSSK